MDIVKNKTFVRLHRSYMLDVRICNSKVVKEYLLSPSHGANVVTLRFRSRPMTSNNYTVPLSASFYGPLSVPLPTSA